MIPVCRISDIPTQGGLRVELSGRPPIAVFRVGTEYFVTDDTCTHGDASLAEGEVIGVEIECPFHQGAFDLRTGRPTARPCSVPLRTYGTELRGDTLYAAIESRSKSADAEDNDCGQRNAI
jgi:nitrite reductase/ring-hydroxylating ferredoxin subunit